MHFMHIGPTSDRESSLTETPAYDEYAKFYIAYGECFSAWSNVEVSLFNVYLYLLQSPEYDAAAAAFYSITGF